jgi:hypothetical protein
MWMDEKLCNPVPNNRQKLISDVLSGWSMHPKGRARVIAKWRMNVVAPVTWFTMGQTGFHGLVCSQLQGGLAK